MTRVRSVFPIPADAKKCWSDLTRAEANRRRTADDGKEAAMTAASRRPGPRLGRIALWFAAMMMPLISNGTSVTRAQQVGPGDPVIEPAASPTLEKSEPTGTA